MVYRTFMGIVIHVQYISSQKIYVHNLAVRCRIYDWDLLIIPPNTSSSSHDHNPDPAGGTTKAVGAQDDLMRHWLMVKMRLVGR